MHHDNAITEEALLINIAIVSGGHVADSLSCRASKGQGTIETADSVPMMTFETVAPRQTCKLNLAGSPLVPCRLAMARESRSAVV